MNEKISRIDAEVQVCTGKKIIIDQNSPYKANALHSYENKTKQNKDYECFANFLSPGSCIKPFYFLSPHSLVVFKSLVSKVEVFEARSLKAGQIGKRPLQASPQQASQALGGQCMNPKWFTVIALPSYCHSLLPEYTAQSTTGWTCRGEGLVLSAKGGSPTNYYFVECTRKDARELNSPCCMKEMCACLHVCFSMSGCSSTNTFSQRQSQFKKLLLWLQVPTHLPQLSDALVAHFI